MSGILLLAEHFNGKLKRYSAELVSVAAGLSSSFGGKVSALLVGEDTGEAAKELGRYGVQKVIIISHPELKFYSGEGYAKVVCDSINSENPDIVIGSSTEFGRDLLSRVAAILKAGFATDCVALRMDGEKLVVRRPMYAGKVLSETTFNGKLKIAALRPNSFPEPQPKDSLTEIVRINTDPGVINTRVKEITQTESDMVDISESDRIVAGGRAMGSAENFKILKELADAIKGQVGASRAAVDAKYISHDHQVGQTGKIVNPSLYIACGISGAIQHLAGMRTSKVIVAINKDTEAPIFSKADYGIVRDLFEVVPALTRHFKKLLQE